MTYQDSCKTEEKARPLFERTFAIYHDTVEPITGQGQFDQGDYVVQTRAGDRFTVECKAEERWTGNLFVEMWSNRSTGRRGWLHNLNACDWLWYLFLDNPGSIYLVHMPSLRAFIGSLTLLDKPRDEGGHLIPQRKHAQQNDSWGVLVSAYRVCRDKYSPKNGKTLHLGFGEHYRRNEDGTLRAIGESAPGDTFPDGWCPYGRLMTRLGCLTIS